MKTLYEKHQKEWDEIAKTRPNTAEMSKHFTRYSHMSGALGYIWHNTVQKWLDFTHNVSMNTERRAAEWLASRDAAPKQPHAPETNGDLIMVAVPQGAMGKLTRVLDILGCEVIE